MRIGRRVYPLELLSFGGEPSYDQLITGFPYLNTVVQENLRFRPAAQGRVHQANEDDVIPLSEPVRTKSGEVVHSIAIETWDDTKVFKPERWLEPDGITKKAQERWSEDVKTVIKNFVLEMRDRPDSKVEMTRGIKTRPKVAGKDGIKSCCGKVLAVRRPSRQEFAWENKSVALLVSEDSWPSLLSNLTSVLKASCVSTSEFIVIEIFNLEIAKAKVNIQVVSMRSGFVLLEFMAMHRIERPGFEVRTEVQQLHIKLDPSARLVF
ncbi:hypothetical protein PISMIDRAFT_15239 [Pisolithus microcarpus 441]|uniref:Uncharacterized protein n=1 Tax=Pisolithus microcarpus 441 TaxID=765257 RepID=A0A0C9YKT5_9AGAM|nr:hypothetical protein PISMIDRAFT_15239 [Pisolithus microcarpus 441]